MRVAERAVTGWVAGGRLADTVEVSGSQVGAGRQFA